MVSNWYEMAGDPLEELRWESKTPSSSATQSSPGTSNDNIAWELLRNEEPQSHLRSTRSEGAFEQDHQVIHSKIQFEKCCLRPPIYFPNLFWAIEVVKERGRR